MIPTQNFLMALLLFFLALIRLYDKDFFGTSVFLAFSSLFFSAGFLERAKIKAKKEADDRKKTFFSVAYPKITSRSEGYSQIITLIVPSLELFNEMNSGNIQNKK